MANDTSVQTTVDGRVMATILEFLEQQGADIRSVSELGRVSHEMLAEILVSKLGAREVTDVDEAEAMVQRITYGTSLFNNRRVGAARLKNHQNAAIEDSLQFDEATSLLPKSRGRQPNWTEADDARLRAAAKKTITSPKIQEMLEKYRKENS